jgi:hypothetical protein
MNSSYSWSNEVAVPLLGQSKAACVLEPQWEQMKAGPEYWLASRACRIFSRTLLESLE